jgi:hypothetical protein
MAADPFPVHYRDGPGRKLAGLAGSRLVQAMTLAQPWIVQEREAQELYRQVADRFEA